MVNFIKVLDVIEPDEEDEGEQVDRQYWVKLGRTRSLEIMDAALSLFPKGSIDLRVKYNRGHAAVGSTANNFLWIYPKKGNFIGITIDVGETARDSFLKKLEEVGIDCSPSTRHEVTLKLSPTLKAIQENRDLIQKIFVTAEKWSTSD